VTPFPDDDDKDCREETDDERDASGETVTFTYTPPAPRSSPSP
jgi:hypothetical protein